MTETTTKQSTTKQPVSKATDNTAAASEQAPEKQALQKSQKKARRSIQRAHAYIKCSYNNSMITVTDTGGAVLGWASSGSVGFKGAKKATPYAATQVVNALHDKISKYGIQELEVYVRGVGSGRESSIRSLANRGYRVSLIKDITPIPHNGCRPRRPRRV